MVKQIIKEAMEKNPIGLKEAVESELMKRLAIALEAKKKSYKEEDHDEDDLEESKMSDKEVLSAAKSLAKNGKDTKTRSFGQGLVDYYNDNGSFTPAQVGGLQNIMKNASFQLAKEDLDEEITDQNKKDAQAVLSYAKKNHGKGIATSSGDNRIIPNINIVRYLESIGKVKNVKKLPSGDGWKFELK